MSLSTTEEELMQHLWELEQAYLNELLEKYDEPRPAPSTIATLLKRMMDKGYVSYNQHGRSREYYPMVQKTTYFSRHFDELKKKFFGNSATQFASFFASETNLTASELKELKKMVEQEIKKKDQ